MRYKLFHNANENIIFIQTEITVCIKECKKLTWSLSVMESQYHRFSSPDNSSNEERKHTSQPGEACISFDSDFTIDYHRP